MGGLLSRISLNNECRNANVLWLSMVALSYLCYSTWNMEVILLKIEYGLYCGTITEILPVHIIHTLNMHTVLVDDLNK